MVYISLLYIIFLHILFNSDVEYWTESDNQVDEDFPFDTPEILEGELCSDSMTGEELNYEQKRFIWWIVAFTCLLQTLHMVSLRGITLLLKFLHVMLLCLEFPSTLYQQSTYYFIKNCHNPIISKLCGVF